MSKNRLIGRRVMVRQVYGTTTEDAEARRFVGRVGTISEVVDEEGTTSTWPIRVTFTVEESPHFKPVELQYLNNRPVIFRKGE